MGDLNKMTAKKIEVFLGKLAELVESLPTREMKDKTAEELDTLINFLMEFQDRMKSIPTIEETKEISSTVEKLITLVKVADSDPFLSRTLGLSSQKTDTRSKRKSLTEAERTNVKELVRQLNELSPQELDEKLQDVNTYKTIHLRQLANELGIKLASKVTRASVIEKITKKISNIRGYDYLRNREDEQH